MRYFPQNTTMSFVTELPQAVHLHGEWEVALNEIQFFTTFLHINHGENVIRFDNREPHGSLQGIPDKLFIYCDICEPYITGDVQTPFLRIVPVELQHYGHYYAYGANQVKYFLVPQRSIR